MLIREATDEDWPRIYPFWAAIVEAGRTYAFPPGLSLAQARPWWMEQAPGSTVVACEGDAVLGSAKMGPNRPGRGSHVATASFMVDPAHRGKGVGRLLGEHVVGWARETGYRSMQFNAVDDTHTGAVPQSKSLGFEVIATLPEAFDDAHAGLVGLHVMHLRL
jgi:L-amino acid N-acyltransferase YncA